MAGFPLVSLEKTNPTRNGKTPTRLQASRKLSPGFQNQGGVSVSGAPHIFRANRLAADSDLFRRKSPRLRFGVHPAWGNFGQTLKNAIEVHRPLGCVLLFL